MLQVQPRTFQGFLKSYCETPMKLNVLKPICVIEITLKKPGLNQCGIKGLPHCNGVESGQVQAGP